MDKLLRLFKLLSIVTAFIFGMSLEISAQNITISNFTPKSGAVGTTVTISGTNFNTTAVNNIVIFGATRATVTAATATELTVTVPTGATYAPVTVLNTETDLIASTNSNFTPTFSPNKSSITATDFETKVDFATGADPFSVAIGDLDGDGKADLVLANFTSNTVSVLRNIGSPGVVDYAEKVDFNTNTNPISVAIGDLDGDGKADLAVANYSSTNVSVLRNTSTIGTINFEPKVDFATGANPHLIAIDDFDGDGKADIAVANRNSTFKVSVLRNTSIPGNISYETKIDFLSGGVPYSIATGDLDGDGKSDLAVANYNSNRVSVLRNESSSGTINFAPKDDFFTGGNPHSVAIGDLDGDGKADLATANYGDATVSVLHNRSTTGDIDFAFREDFPTGPLPISVAIGDLNGDGKADLATANYGSGERTVSVLRNIGAPEDAINYATKVDFTTYTGPVLVAIGDLDGDGKADLAVANRFSDFVSVIRNNPDFIPFVTAYSPADDETGLVEVNTDLILTFNEDIQKGTGNILIKEDGVITQTIPVTDASVTVSGNTVTINPEDFTIGATVNIEMDAGVFKDLTDNNYSGITGPTTWNFVAGLLSQMISFDALGDQTYGDANFDLTATASSGLPVNYTSSDQSVATINGSEVTITGAGTTTITASQEGNSDYKSAPSVEQTFTVNKSSQTITFDALPTKNYDVAAFNLTATASSGLSVNYTSSDQSVATINGSEVTIIGTGTTTITASQEGNSDYKSAPSVEQTFTVNKSSQTITFDALPTKNYGDAAFNLTATASSDLLVEYTSSNLNVATINGSEVTIIGTGTTTITASHPGNANYKAASSVGQSLTVNKGSQTITFESLENRTYGDEAFDLTATSSSALELTFSSSDETVATIEGKTVTIIGAGTATITATQAGNQNYEQATAVEQILTVNKAAQSITFESLEAKTYGDANFDLTATASSGLELTYSSSDETVATIDGNTVSIVGGGTASITANQSGNSNYEAASATEQILTVNKAAQSISITAIEDKLVDAAPFEVVAIVNSGLDLTYSLTGPATISGNTITLDGSEGTVEVTVSQSGNTNYNSTSASISFEVTDPCIDFGAEAINITNVLCNGEANGSFEILATGTEPFLYTMDGTDQESEIFSNLTAGDYDVIVTDGNNCTQTVTVTVKEPAMLTISGEVANSNSTDGNGSISLTANGGTGNLSYEWSNGATSANISELTIGEYTVTVTDENGCSLTEKFTISGVTANGEKLNSQVSIYPNPTSQSIKILHAEAVEIITLYNAQGKLILTQKAKGTESNLQLTQLPIGLYFIQLDNSAEMHRIVKK
ncbi:FG-GAP-like repeat-containing protein [Marivirga salinae]|uniref:FG-GAP-like repeat-containing protein n=1 Tax=Marivirga salinarum TaxID=3059078 RepID=A0AA51NCX7_9BACT|nr:FG-GAP-like repeat-containing protein [Marivirga sp. BDSF4-3]WMN12979.1 FG-GAP-like repeat-containing protein [Marivirga sp. BDSF4-3]